MSVESINQKLTAPATSSKPAGVPGLLEKMKPQMAAALPKHVDVNRMTRIALTEFRKTPALTRCDPKSFLGAVMQSAQLGLEPGSSLGHCYLLPFKNQVQLIIGYRGMIDLARRSGQIISLTARAVYKDDEFKYSYGLDETLTHIPSEDIEQKSADLTHVYAVAKLKGGGTQFEVLSRGQIELIRKSSRSGNSGPWLSHYEEMAKKTAIRRLFKYLPVSVEVQQAASLDEKADAGIEQDNASVIDIEFEAVDGLSGEELKADEPT